MARKLTVEIIGDSRKLEQAFSRSARSAKQFNQQVSHAGRTRTVFGGLGRSVTGLAGAFVGSYGLATAVRSAFGEMADAQKVSAQTQAVLKSTAGAANVSAKQVDTLATSLMNLSGTDDEVIKSGENLLLTFTNIRNSAGKGNNVFTQATKAALDLSVALGQDMKSSAIQLGKALNDPVRGITALRRVGVSFTESQVKLIKRLVESGRTLEAQKVILRELQKEFGGSARAAGETLSGKLNILRENVLNLAGAFAQQLSPQINALIDRATKWIQNTENQRRVMNDLKQVAGAVGDVLGAVKGAMSGLNDITGSTKNTVKLLVGAFVVFKTAKIASTLANVATQVANIGINAKKTRGQLGKPGAGGGGGWFGPVTAAALALGTVTGGQVWKNIFKLGEQLGVLKKKAEEAAPPFKEMTRVAKAGAAAVNRAMGATAAARGAAAAGAVAGAAPGRGGGGFTRAQRNQFFDARIGRILTRASYKELQGQLAAYKQVAALLAKRITTTRDITRKLKLEDQLLSVQAQIKGTRAELAANAVQAAQDRAEKAREAAEKVRQAAARVVARRQARQFRALGFGPGGEDLVPGAAALRKQLASVRGMSGLTAKMRAQIQHIGKVLAGTWGKVGKDVRAKIQEMLKGIRDELEGKGAGGDQTKFRHVGTTAILKGLGLTPQQAEALRGRLAQIGPGGRVPARHTPAFASAGGVHFYGATVNLNGVQNLRDLENQLTKRHAARAHNRRGAR